MRDQEYEDLLQTALEVVLVSMRKNEFRGDSSLSTWAATIARNVAIDALRARARARRVFAHEADAQDVAARRHSMHPNPERLADVREQLAHYRDALTKLCPDKARVVYLHEVLGHRLEEIAGMLGISVAATQSRLVRGRRDIGDAVASLERRSPDLSAEEVPGRSGYRWRAARRRALEPNSESADESGEGGSLEVASYRRS